MTQDERPSLAERLARALHGAPHYDGGRQQVGDGQVAPICPSRLKGPLAVTGKQLIEFDERFKSLFEGFVKVPSSLVRDLLEKGIWVQEGPEPCYYIFTPVSVWHGPLLED